MSSTTAEQVSAEIERRRLIEPGEVVIVAVSGGPDSLALLHVLVALRHRLRITLHVAHLDHMLRGADSAADAAFVAATAAAWGLPATVTAVDVGSLAQIRRLNLHDAARRARYRFLWELANNLPAQVVAVAHTADDQAETVLMHLLRGSGTAGLRGIRQEVGPAEWAAFGGDAPLAVSPAPSWPRLVRPLLAITRDEIEAYCTAEGLLPRRDATNAATTYTRNRIRHELLPLLRSYNPQIISALSRTAAICAADHACIGAALAATWPELASVRADGIDLDGRRWRALDPALQREALRMACHVLNPGDPPAWERIEQARTLIDHGVRTQVDLGGGLALTVGYGGDFTIGNPAPEPGPQLPAKMLALPIPTQVALRGGWLLELDVWPAPAPDRHDRWVALIDMDRLPGPLAARRRRPGDRIRPAGAPGSRRLQDLFVDARVPRTLRDAWPIIVSGDAIVWVAGLRIAADYIATAQTRRVLCIQVRPPYGQPVSSDHAT